MDDTDVITDDDDADACRPPALLSAGYRDCSLHALAACENSNQLFWGPDDRCGHATRKEEIWEALDHFLTGAPTPYDTEDAGYVAASDIGEALLGPGPGQHLASGEWFFSGFTPHAAMVRAAAVFDARGNIIAVALLDDDGDARSLYVYSHGSLRADDCTRFQSWARNVTSDAFPNDTPSRLDGTIVIELGSKRWTTKRLP